MKETVLKRIGTYIMGYRIVDCQKRIGEIVNAYKQLFKEEAEDIFITLTRQTADGPFTCSDLWLFSERAAMQARNFLSPEPFAKVLILFSV